MTSAPEPDDWEPLTDEQLFADDRSAEVRARPGNEPPPLPVRAMPKRPVPMALEEPAVPPVRAGTVEAPVDAAAGERALQAMKEKLAARASRIDPVHAAFARASRKAEPAAAPSPTAPVDPFAATVCSEGVEFEDGHDPREDDAWFLALPQREQERLCATWRADKNQYKGLGMKFVREVRYAALAGAGVFCFVALLTFVACNSAKFTLPLILLGACAGAIARMLDGGRLVYALCGLAAYPLAVRGGLLESTLLFYVWSTAGFSLALLGFDREIRQTGGFSGPRRVTTSPTLPATTAGSQIQSASDSKTSTPHHEKNSTMPSGATAIGVNEKNIRS